MGAHSVICSSPWTGACVLLTTKINVAPVWGLERLLYLSIYLTVEVCDCDFLETAALRSHKR